MIFSRLFKPKKQWQSKDSNTRISAINELLQTTVAEEKAILHALLMTDDNDLVRRAALNKLHDFDAYIQTFTDNDNKALQQFASKQILSILSNKHDIRLNRLEKEQFLASSQSDAFIQAWLDVEDDPELVIELFTQVAKNKNAGHLLAKTFNLKQNEAIQLALLNLPLPELSDRQYLTKLIKKTTSKVVTKTLEDKIAQLTWQKEKPEQLQKDVQLLLSKLLALKDQTQYEVYLDKRLVLENQWQDMLADFHYLTTELQVSFKEKYQHICVQITQIFANRKEIFEQDKIEQQLKEDKQKAHRKFTDTIAEFAQMITTAVFEGTALEAPVFQQQLDTFKSEIANSVLNKEEQQSFFDEVDTLALRFTQVPEIALSVSDATLLISKISQLALPQNLEELNVRQQTYQDWLKQWQAIEKKALGALPKSLKDSQLEINTHWRQGLKPFQTEQKQLFEKNKKKLGDIKRLLTQGKYKVCFGLFKGVKQTQALLSVPQQHQLERSFQEIEEKIAELSDWEHYIATPRKQQLLDEITAIVQTPLDSPKDQANKVKQFRKTWNSLGHAEEDVDHALNEQFNEACEQAFAPCRLFYAEQEKIREQHLTTRQDIITQAQKISDSFANHEMDALSDQDKMSLFKQVEGEVNQVQQRWNQAGEVDRKAYQQLQQAFKASLQPVKALIKNFHQRNAEQKEMLINKAKKTLLNEDVFSAVNDIKLFQQQWKTIGFAGARVDNKLWQEFRTLNDQVFSKRDAIKQEQQAEQAETIEQYSQELEQIKQSLTDEVPKTQQSIVTAQNEAEQLLSKVISHKPVIKQVATALEFFIEECKQQQKALLNKAKQQIWHNLFALLGKIAESEFYDNVQSAEKDEYFLQLNNFWQKRIQEHLALKDEADEQLRLKQTLIIEILAQVESPEEYSKERIATQIELMQAQLSSRTDIDLTQQLVDWLKLGRMTEHDDKLLARLAKIYNSKSNLV